MEKLLLGVIGCIKLCIVVVKLYLVLVFLIIVFVFCMIDIGRVRVMLIWFV